ncbi:MULTISPECIES: glycerol-3-phosphate dehydrogenase [unclassified Paracoccus (in: a-proteobacteria)]|uniref:glycerol-3-phosphate dehydrogenase n=1 Tax=unclassified Paracoccus (in: a-proteobacteria) TaxID=2688777 RepID=UPI0012B381AD|nr:MULTISPECIES: glycerol-3-phosphate dehydrogenase [unclassified Paracoccus (in: a-proteobacteria)]UXU76501.1 glycerol-3-phosphate dehydrogenase [Paracoccus sp. SMMA_5]UXU82432.1 glycerol-3-phosphate dehydrogenase [Paracoccus sp. SMMA_5_TC]
MSSAPGQIADLFIIGGGINGCGIARDAAGRGLSVTLAEMGDLAQATSSASTKLFHGGLRYLEFFEFRLVREALEERETLLRAMPHISWPMRFVLPYSPQMRFDSDTPTSRLLGMVMPWMRGRRPAWLIRLGLFLYDNLGGRQILPGTRRLDLANDPLGKPLKPGFRRGWEYSDCWVQDARLVVLNARDAQARGATIMTRTRVTRAERQGDLWLVSTEGPAGPRQHRARALVNAGGPWVENVIRDVAHIDSTEGVRLVRGSHIVVPRLYDHDRCYFFQGSDGRIIFAIPFEDDFTLIGTTDMDHKGAPGDARCTDEERDYLCAFASQYFARPVTPDQVVWTYSGVRPLYNDGAKSATAATRDYVLSLDDRGAPLLNVFGGKITTYRRLAESALGRLARFFPQAGPDWTAGVALPGGDFPVDGFDEQVARLGAAYPFLSARQQRRLVRTYGTEAFLMLDGARSAADLGQDFGAGLTEVEVNWLVREEFARDAQDILWRRTKLGLHMTDEQAQRLAAYVRNLPTVNAAAE